jgi:formylglycine-generating enzyme required for sulfatase activity
MGKNPSYFKKGGESCPVEQVSWEDAQQFIRKLNQIENTKDNRLPSEAEWEYACRAGSDAEFSFGDDVERFDKFAWYSKNSGGETHPVGEKELNSWGLYDMHGNVWEWVEDDWHESYKKAPSEGIAWVDKQRGSSRVIRGGSWYIDAHLCRGARRIIRLPGDRVNDVGFRLSRSVSLGPWQQQGDKDFGSETTSWLQIIQLHLYWFSGKRSYAAFAKLVPSALLSLFDGYF